VASSKQKGGDYKKRKKEPVKKRKKKTKKVRSICKRKGGQKGHDYDEKGSA